MADIRLNAAGDFMVARTADMEYVTGNNETVQNIVIRMKTIKGEGAIVPDMGNLLPEILGLPNVQETATQGSLLIHEALEHDGYMIGGNYNIDTWPETATKLMYEIIVNVGLGSRRVIMVPVDLNQGYYEVEYEEGMSGALYSPIATFGE